ncbi:MAG: hypothetical protein VX589_10045 [Myxococcota bacterium]|nr:hypothetical protein [Myxococcota bacterium]
MKRYLSTLVMCGVLLGSSSAFALGTFGIRLGTGLSFYDGDVTPEPEVTPFAIGASWLLDLSVVELEIDALYWRDSAEVSAMGVTGEQTFNYIATPAIARASFGLIPKLLSISVGGGLEPRFLISADPELVESSTKSTVMYLPISMIAKLNLAVITVGVEVRYEYQLTDRFEGSSDKYNQLVFMGGIDF